MSDLTNRAITILELDVNPALKSIDELVNRVDGAFKKINALQASGGITPQAAGQQRAAVQSTAAQAGAAAGLGTESELAAAIQPVREAATRLARDVARAGTGVSSVAAASKTLSDSMVEGATKTAQATTAHTTSTKGVADAQAKYKAALDKGTITQSEYDRLTAQSAAGDRLAATRRTAEANAKLAGATERMAQAVTADFDAAGKATKDRIAAEKKLAAALQESAQKALTAALGPNVATAGREDFLAAGNVAFKQLGLEVSDRQLKEAPVPQPIKTEAVTALSNEVVRRAQDFGAITTDVEATQLRQDLRAAARGVKALGVSSEDVAQSMAETAKAQADAARTFRQGAIASFDKQLQEAGADFTTAGSAVKAVTKAAEAQFGTFVKEPLATGAISQTGAADIQRGIQEQALRTLHAVAPDISGQVLRDTNKKLANALNQQALEARGVSEAEAKTRTSLVAVEQAAAQEALARRLEALQLKKTGVQLEQQNLAAVLGQNPSLGTAITGGGIFQKIEAALKQRSTGELQFATQQPTLGQFVGSKALTTLGFAASGLGLYGGIQGIQSLVTEATKLNEVFVKLQSTFDQEHLVGFENFKKTILDISATTGVVATDVADAGDKFAAALQNTTLAKGATEQATKFSRLTGDVLSDVVNQTTGVVTSFNNAASQIGSQTSITVKNVVDAAAGAETRFGVPAKEILGFLGSIGPVAAKAGFSLQQTVALAGSFSLASGRSGTSGAEAFGRILSSIDKSDIALLQLNQNTLHLGTAFDQALTHGDTQKVFTDLLQIFPRLNKATQDYIVTLLGGRREAAAFISVANDPTRYFQEANLPANTDSDRVNKQFQALQGTLSQTIARLRTELQRLGLQIFNSGIGKGLTEIVKVGGELVNIFNDMFGVFNKLPDGIKSTLAAIVELSVALKALKALTGLGGATQVQGLLAQLASGQQISSRGARVLADGGVSRSLQGDMLAAGIAANPERAGVNITRPTVGARIGGFFGQGPLVVQRQQENVAAAQKIINPDTEAKIGAAATDVQAAAKPLAEGGDAVAAAAAKMQQQSEEAFTSIKTGFGTKLGNFFGSTGGQAALLGLAIAGPQFIPSKSTFSIPHTGTQNSGNAKVNSQGFVQALTTGAFLGGTIGSAIGPAGTITGAAIGAGIGAVGAGTVDLVSTIIAHDKESQKRIKDAVSAANDTLAKASFTSLSNQWNTAVNDEKNFKANVVTGGGEQFLNPQYNLAQNGKAVADHVNTVLKRFNSDQLSALFKSYGKDIPAILQQASNGALTDAGDLATLIGFEKKIGGSVKDQLNRVNNKAFAQAIQETVKKFFKDRADATIASLTKDQLDTLNNAASGNDTNDDSGALNKIRIALAKNLPRDSRHQFKVDTASFLKAAQGAANLSADTQARLLQEAQDADTAITTTQELSQQYANGTISLKAYVFQVRKNDAGLRALVADTSASQNTREAALKTLLADEKGLQDATNTALSNAVDNANSIEELFKGADDPGTIKDEISRAVGILNDPRYTDKQGRINFAKQIVTLERNLLKNMADRAGSAAEAAKFLQQGITLPPEVQQILTQGEIAGNFEADNAAGAIAAGTIGPNGKPRSKDYIEGRIAAIMQKYNKSFKDAVYQLVLGQVQSLLDQKQQLISAFGEEATNQGQFDTQIVTLLNALDPGVDTSIQTLAKDLNITVDAATALVVNGMAKAHKSAEQIAIDGLTDHVKFLVNTREAIIKQFGEEATNQDAFTAQINQALKDINDLQGIANQNKIPNPTFQTGDKITGTPTDLQSIADKQRQQAIDLLKAQQNLFNAMHPGDTLAVAQEAIDSANQELANAQKDTDAVQKKIDTINALADKINAENSFKDAFVAIGNAQLDLLIAYANAAGDTVTAAQLQLQKDEGALKLLLAKGYKQDSPDVKAARAQIVGDVANVRDSKLQTAEDQIDFELQMNKITKGVAIARLKGLLSLASGDVKETHDLLLKIKSLQDSSGADLQFNLPSNLVLPTIYQARRLDQSGPGGFQDNRNIRITVYTSDPKAAADQVAANLAAPARTGAYGRRY